jgi:hypothetical protein
MSSREFAEWMAYYALEPWGEERADLRAGIVAAAAIAPWTKKGSTPPRPSDFMPKFGQRSDPPRPQSVEAHKRAALMYTKLFRGEIRG